MAIPVLLWGVAATLGATGVFKGAKAVIDIDEAKEIGEKAERRYEDRKKQLDEIRNDTNKIFKELGILKATIFQTQIAHIIKLLKQQKNSGSELKDYEEYFSEKEIKEMERMVKVSLDITSNLATSATAGALTGLAVYGTIPLLATASTGTAIASLSGVAATNATLAWLGGGSLAAGGFGMSGGMIALGGIVAGPALAVGGFMLASKAEEQLTKAHAYRAEVDKAIAKFEQSEEVLKALQANANEVIYTLNRLVSEFEKYKVEHYTDAGYNELLLIGRNLKDVLNIRIMKDDGSAVSDVGYQCSGYLKI